MSLTGCTAAALRHETTNVSVSIGDVYQQEVLDNLARFIKNDPNAFPSFAYANQGAADVTDEGSLGRGGDVDSQFLSDVQSVGIENHSGFLHAHAGQRSARARADQVRSFSGPFKAVGTGPSRRSVPIAKLRSTGFIRAIRPRKLKMHSSEKSLRSVSRMRGPGSVRAPRNACRKAADPGGPLLRHVHPSGPAGRSGISHSVDDRHHGLRDERALVPLTKQVTYYLDENGVPTTRKLAVGQVTAGVAITEDPISLLNTANQTEVQIDMQLQQQMRKTRPRSRTWRQRTAAISQRRIRSRTVT